MKNVFLVAAFLVIVLLCPVSIDAADIYVKAGASGKGTSPQDPLGALWKAVDRAKRGDVVHVAAGTYNGKGGSGHFIITVPNLTLAGGYNADFTVRNPFKNLTVLERAKDYKGDWGLLPEGIISGGEKTDHSGLIVDGFVLNCESRNRYKNDVVAMKAPTYPGKAFQANAADIKIRNCIIANPVGEGIYITWQGKENEITNCFILNTFYAAIECRSAQPASEVLIRNNTIAFGWFYPSKGGSMGIFVGLNGKLRIENNIIAFFQTEGSEAGFGVGNLFGNEDTVMKDNLFFSCVGGYYKYMDANKASLLVYTKDGFDDLNDEDLCEEFMLAESGGNMEGDPKFSPDKDYITKYAGFIEAGEGKLDMDEMNEWRRSIGLPLQAGKGAARQNFGFAYPLLSVVPDLVSARPGLGAKADVEFIAYTSAAAEAAPAEYEAVELVDFKKAGKYEKGNSGRAVMFRAQMGENQTVFELANAPKKDYVSVLLAKPGVSLPTRECTYGYILKGSDAHKAWEKLYKKRNTYNADGGVTIKGTAFDFGNTAYPYPVGIIILEVLK